MTKTNDSISKYVVIAELNRMIDQDSFFSFDVNTRTVDVDYIKQAISNIESLPVQPTVESLLDEMPYMATLTNMTTYWVAQTKEQTATGNTPSSSLLALKDKLSN